MSLTINIVGSGRVATHLYKALSGKARVSMISSRTFQPIIADKGPESVPFEDADLYIVAVSDNATEQVCCHLQNCVKGIVAHTAGALDLPGVDVFYPLQSFSHDMTPDYSAIPILIESEDPGHKDVLRAAASLISDTVEESTPQQRSILHLAAVFASNFTNHMLTAAEDILATTGLSPALLMPLVNETLRKAQAIGPRAAQTGPAVRGDLATVRQEGQLLEQLCPQYLKIYDAVSESIGIQKFPKTHTEMGPQISQNGNLVPIPQCDLRNMNNL